MNDYEVVENNRKNVLKNLRVKLIVGVIVIAVIFCIEGILCYKIYKRAEDKYEEEIIKLKSRIEELSDPIAVYEPATKEVDISVISSQIKKISELASMEYLYTDANRFSDPKQFLGVNIPFSEKSFIVKWDGTIKAGMDVSQITLNSDEEDHVIVVQVPQAKILSHEIDENSFETLDEKDGLFNPIKIDDIRNLDAVSKKEMEQRAIENGLLEKASENAQEVILKLLNANPIIGENYSVVFEMIP